MIHLGLCRKSSLWAVHNYMLYIVGIPQYYAQPSWCECGSSLVLGLMDCSRWFRSELQSTVLCWCWWSPSSSGSSCVHLLLWAAVVSEHLLWLRGYLLERVFGFNIDFMCCCQRSCVLMNWNFWIKSLCYALICWRRIVAERLPIVDVSDSFRLQFSIPSPAHAA